MIPLSDFFIFALAVFRVSSLIAIEDGPFNILLWLRIKAGQSYDEYSQPYAKTQIAELLMCQWCNSVWLGLGVTLLYWWLGYIAVWLMLPLALSAVAVLLSR